MDKLPFREILSIHVLFFYNDLRYPDYIKYYAQLQKCKDEHSLLIEERGVRLR